MMSVQSKKGSTLGATALVIGKIIGIVALGTPIASGLTGFYPALIITFIVWIWALATALLYLEALLGVPDGANFSSTVARYLGKTTKYVGIVIYLIVNAPLFIAYFHEIGLIIGDLFVASNTQAPSLWLTITLTALIFGVIAYLGTWVTDKINFVLVIGLIVSLVYMLFRGYSFVSSDYLARHNWFFMFLAVPILFGAFDFQNILPTLSTYLKRDARCLKKALFFGTFISLLIFVALEWLILGSFTEGPLWIAYQKGGAISQGFHLFKVTAWLRMGADFFAFFAITTSILGQSISLIDFTGDALSIGVQERVGLKRLVLLLIVFIPAYLLSLIDTPLFLRFLSYLAGFGQIIVSSLFPVAMVWVSRYRLKLSTPPLVPGGKTSLALLVIATFYFVWFQALISIH